MNVETKAEYIAYLKDIGYSTIGDPEGHNLTDFNVLSVVGFLLANGVIKDLDFDSDVGRAFVETIEQGIVPWRSWRYGVDNDLLAPGK